MKRPQFGEPVELRRGPQLTRALLGGAAAAALALSGCTTGGANAASPAQQPATTAPVATAAAEPDPAQAATLADKSPAEPVDVAAAAHRMMECLRLGGLSASIDENEGSIYQGVVSVLFDSVPYTRDADGILRSNSEDFKSVGDQAFAIERGFAEDDAGNVQLWVAPVDARVFRSGDEHNREFFDVWSRCEAENPDFVQPAQEFIQAKLQQEINDRTEIGLEFAQCARAAGFAWVADPTPTDPSNGAVAIPSTVTEAEFRALAAECDTGSNGPTWAWETGLAFNPVEILSDIQAEESG